MNRRTRSDRKLNPALVDTQELMKILSTGRPAAVRIGMEAEAKMQMGRLVRWNVEKIYEYIDSVSEG